MTRREGLAVAAALALGAAACSVGVEGAACTAPGTTTECPAGQACGLDLRCSTRAASCTMCEAGAQECRDGSVKACSTARDPACGTWEIVEGKDCAARGLLCDAGTGPNCKCDGHAADAPFLVDAAVGGDPADPEPNGNASPAECRFRSLGAALSAAAAHGPGATVVIAGTPTNYGAATGDAAPYVIPAGVALTTEDQPAAPASRVLLVEGNVAAGVTVAAGSELVGVTVRNASAPAAVGVAVQCGAGDPAALGSVRVESDVGAPPFNTGIRLEGECPVTVTDPEVRGASQAGLEVQRATRPATAIVERGLLHGNGIGVRLARGDLTLHQTVIRRSFGVALDAGGTDFDRAGLTLRDVLLHYNDDIALVVSALDRLDAQGARICGNGALTDRGVVTKRKVGGLYGEGAPPSALSVKHDSFFANAGDQVAISGSNATWSLDGATDASTCDSDANVFAGYSSGYFGVVANGAPVSALWNVWANVVPAGSSDYKAISPGTIDAGAQDGRYCTTPLATSLDCPVPPPR